MGPFSFAANRNVMKLIELLFIIALSGSARGESLGRPGEAGVWGPGEAPCRASAMVSGNGSAQTCGPRLAAVWGPGGAMSWASGDAMSWGPGPAAGPYAYKVFRRGDGAYGYLITAGGKSFIRQESIPALAGNRGFAHKEEAASVAKLVIGKLQQHIFPPTVTSAELERLHIW